MYLIMKPDSRLPAARIKPSEVTNVVYQMSPYKAFAVALVLYAGILICALLGSLLPVCVPSPTGLSECRMILDYFQLLAAERGGPVSVAELRPTEREDVRLLRIRSRILITQAPLQVGARGRKEIVAVCKDAFKNVHAVAYSNGATGVLSDEKFRRRDFSSFVDVRTIAEKEGR